MTSKTPFAQGAARFGRRLSRGLVVGIVLVSGAAAATPAGAAGLPPSPAAQPAVGSQNSFGFSAQPYAASGTSQRSQFTYGLQPGHSTLDQVAVVNSSKVPETFEVYPEDATNIPGTGSFGFQDQSHIHNVAVGKWITIGQRSFTVPAGQAIVDAFEVAIPSDAPPGDHVGAVVVQEVKGSGASAKLGVNIVLRIAVPVYVRVVGPTHSSLTIEHLTVFHGSPLLPYVGNDKVAVRVTLVNTGNVILDPRTASVSISGLVGGTIHSFTLHRTSSGNAKKNPLPAQMLPGARLTLTELWNGLPPFDPMTAHVSALAVDAVGGIPVSVAATAGFWYFPWLVVVIVLVLIAAFFLWRRRRRDPRGPRTPGEAPVESSGGTLVASGTGSPPGVPAASPARG